jgi:AcrR family transcriptional regulator
MSRCGMVKKKRGTQRRQEALSRDRIIEASIALLDSSGEGGLTFRILSERLATGPGAIYWHIPNKSELLTAACDAIVARMMNAHSVGATPEATIRALALGMFDTIDVHPWVGSALTRAPGQLPMVRILEGIAQQVRALGVPDEEQWSTVGALLNYILGVGGQNAANGQLARTRGIDRSDFLETVSTAWSQLDPNKYPFTRSVAAHLRVHDDRADFLAGIDLILRGIRGLRTDRIELTQGQSVTNRASTRSVTTQRKRPA